MFPNLRAEMARRNISVHKLAKMIGMSDSTMADKWHGRTSFSLEHAIAIKNALGVDMELEELFQKEEE
jgi:transcriptional regulator with XRE-family HTH domain